MLKYLVSYETAKMLAFKGFPQPDFEKGQFWYTSNDKLVVTVSYANDMGELQWRCALLNSLLKTTIISKDEGYIYVPNILDFSKELGIPVNFNTNPEELAVQWLETNKNKKMIYNFSNGSTIEGDLEQLVKIAEILGEKLDTSKIHERAKGYYLSNSKGVIKISEMNDIHLRNAIQKATVTYFSNISRTISNEQWMNQYLSFQDDSLVQELFAELQKRI